MTYKWYNSGIVTCCFATWRVRMLFADYLYVGCMDRCLHPASLWVPMEFLSEPIPELEKIIDYERQKCQTFAKFQDTHLSLERHHNEWHLRRRSSCLFKEAFRHTCYINRVKTRRNMYVIWLSHLNLPQIGYYAPRFISEIHRTLMASHEIWSPKRVGNRPSTCLPICPGRNPPRRTRRWRQVIT